MLRHTLTPLSRSSFHFSSPSDCSTSPVDGRLKLAAFAARSSAISAFRASTCRQDLIRAAV